MQINFFKPKNNFKKKRIEPNPNFYWKIAVLCTLILMVCVFGFGYYMFTMVNDEAPYSSETTIKKEPVEKERLEKILDYYAAKNKKLNQIINTDAPVVDPSL